MLTELTALKIDAALLELELLQRSGDPEAPAPGQVSLAWLARRAGVGEATIHHLSCIALAKVARGLRGDGLPPHLAKAVCHLIDDASQPELDLF
jgi:hypothetical protein